MNIVFFPNNGCFLRQKCLESGKDSCAFFLEITSLREKIRHFLYFQTSPKGCLKHWRYCKILK